MKNTIRERVARNDLVCQQCFVWKKARVVPVQCASTYIVRVQQKSRFIKKEHGRKVLPGDIHIGHLFVWMFLVSFYCL